MKLKLKKFHNLFNKFIEIIVVTKEHQSNEIS